MAGAIDNQEPLSPARGVHDGTPAQRSFRALHVARRRAERPPSLPRKGIVDVLQALNRVDRLLVQAFAVHAYPRPPPHQVAISARNRPPSRTNEDW